VTDLGCTRARNASTDDINASFLEAAAEPRFDGIIAVTHVAPVSAGTIGRPQSWNWRPQIGRCARDRWSIE